MNGSLLTAKDLASILRISLSRAFKLMRDGSIPVVRIGKNVRVKMEDLERFIEDCRTDANKNEASLVASPSGLALKKANPKL